MHLNVYNAYDYMSYRQGLYIKDEEVEGHGQTDGSQQPHVLPGGHTKQRLVLGNATKQ